MGGFGSIFDVGMQCDLDSFTCPNGTVVFRNMTSDCSFPECFGINVTASINDPNNLTTVHRQNAAKWFLDREFIVPSLDIRAVRRGKAFESRMLQSLAPLAPFEPASSDQNITAVKIYVTTPSRNRCNVTTPASRNESHLPLSTHRLSRFAFLGTISKCQSREALALTLHVLSDSTVNNFRFPVDLPKNTSLQFRNVPVLAVESSNSSPPSVARDRLTFRDGSSVQVSDILSQLGSLYTRGNSSREAMAGVAEGHELGQYLSKSSLDVTFLSFSALAWETTMNEEWNEQAIVLGRWLGIPHPCANNSEWKDSDATSLVTPNISSSNCSCWRMRTTTSPRDDPHAALTFADVNGNNANDRHLRLCDAHSEISR